MIAIQASPAISDQKVSLDRLLLRPSWSASWNEYAPATCARLAITITSAAMIPQPPIQPTIGPNARVAQVKVVPQSGSASLRSLYATAMKYIGTNASSMIAGAFNPAPAETTRPRLAAREYAGAVDAIPTTTLLSRPNAPGLRPLLSTVPSVLPASGWVIRTTLLASPPLPEKQAAIRPNRSSAARKRPLLALSGHRPCEPAPRAATPSAAQAPGRCRLR